MKQAREERNAELAAVTAQKLPDEVLNGGESEYTYNPNDTILSQLRKLQENN